MFRRSVAASLAVMALACALWPVTARAADPIVLFLLRMMRDQVISSTLESASSRPQAPRPSAGGAAPAPQPEGESARLQRLIGESFVHLAPQQRLDLHASLLRVLDDPKNAGQRGAIVAEFTAQANGVRQAHRQLSQLSEDDMRAVAAEARVEFARLPPGQRRELLQAMERGIPGMPRTLQELILAEFGSVPGAQ